MNFFTVAFKNLWRAKVRTTVTLLTIVLSVVTYIFMDSLTKGISEESFANLREYELGYGKIMKTEAFDEVEKPSLEYLFDYSSIGANLKKQNIPFIPRLQTEADLIFYKDDGFIIDGSSKVHLVALNSDYESVKGLTQGVTLKQAEVNTTSGVWVSQFLLNKLHGKLGSPLIISTKTAEGSYEALDVTVVGIFATPDAPLNMGTILISSKTLSKLFSFSDTTQATELVFPSYQKHMNISLPKELKYYPWEELAKDLVALSEFEQNRFVIFTSLIFSIITIGIINTMLMTVYERFKEIGTMRAFGTSNREILTLFTLEGLIIGIIGSVVGIVIGSLLNIPLVTIGIDYSSLAENIKMGYRLPGAMHGTWSISGMLKVSIISMVLSSLSTLIAARNAVKKSVIECLSR